MATVAEYTIPAEEFPLGRIFESMPDVTVQLDRVVPTSHGLLPYFWVRDGDMEAVEDAVAGHPALESVTLIDDLGGQGLFRAEWNEEYEGLITAIGRTPVTLLTATGSHGEWVFEVRADEPADISTFQQYCQDHGVDFTLTRLHRLTEMHAGSQYDLTEAQTEALVLAFNRGYYDDQRQTNLETLANELGISRRSLSDRLRRGYRNLVESTLVRE